MPRRHRSHDQNAAAITSSVARADQCSPTEPLLAWRRRRFLVTPVALAMRLTDATAGVVGRRIAGRETVVDLFVDAGAGLVLGLLMGRRLDVAHASLP